MLANEHLTHSQFPEAITTVGVELEGYWSEDDERNYRTEYRQANLREADDWMALTPSRCGSRPAGFKYDGSVHSRHRYHSGEIATPGKGFKTWAPLRQWILEHYPTRVDAFCGLHIHLGVTRDQLTYAFDTQFWKALKEELPKAVSQHSTKRWLVNRLADGRSSAAAGRYSSPNSMVTGIGRWTSSARYRAVNYMGAYNTHKTMEIRVLPMAATTSGPEKGSLEAVKMVWRTLAISSDFFTNTKWQRKISGKATVKEGGIDLPLPLGTETALHTEVTLAQDDEHIAAENDRGSRLNTGATRGCNCVGCEELNSQLIV